jgi:hypothetical protein
MGFDNSCRRIQRRKRQIFPYLQALLIDQHYFNYLNLNRYISITKLGTDIAFYLNKAFDINSSKIPNFKHQSPNKYEGFRVARTLNP